MCVYVCIYIYIYAVLSCLVMSDSLQPHGLQPARFLCPREFSRQEFLSGLPCPPPGDLPNPGIKPRFPVLQADFFPSEPLGKSKNTGVGSLSLLHRIFPTQESNRGLLPRRWILYQLSRAAPCRCICIHTFVYIYIDTTKDG